MYDGWMTITHHHLLNYLVYSPLGTVFIKSNDATDSIQDERYINKLFNGVIDNIGVNCVVQAFTKSFANMKKIGLILMKQRPKIF